MTGGFNTGIMWLECSVAWFEEDNIIAELSRPMLDECNESTSLYDLAENKIWNGISMISLSANEIVWFLLDQSQG